MTRVKDKITELEHSMLGPSSAVRRLKCEASLKQEAKHVAQFGSSSSIYADDGTHAHKALELWLIDSKVACERYLKEHFGDLWQDHRDNLKEAVEWTMEYEAKGYALAVEERYDLTHLHPTCFGTADITLFNSKLKHLVIGDFKYGQGVGVYADYGAFERVEEKSIIGLDANVQGVMYASGALKKLGLSDDEIINWRITIAIIQPRHGDESIKQTEVTGFELVYAQDFIRDAYAKLDDDGEKTYRIGDHCQFCEARPNCPAHHQRVMEAFEDISTLTPEVKTMVEEKTAPQEKTKAFTKDLEKLRRIYEMKGELNKFFTQLEGFIKDCIEKGYGDDLGLELVPGRGRRAYPEGIRTPKALCEILSTLGVMINEDQVSKKDILPFTKVLQILDKKDRPLLEELLIQVPGSPKIKPTTQVEGDLLMDFGGVNILD